MRINLGINEYNTATKKHLLIFRKSKDAFFVAVLYSFISRYFDDDCYLKELNLEIE